MKKPHLLLALALTVSAALAGEEPEHERDQRPIPLAKSAEFPSHPWKGGEEEAKSWKGSFAKPLQMMLKAGLPDPAGLPYHRIGIGTGNAYSGNSGITPTEGWILPAQEDGSRYAIAWNGLVYPLIDDRGEADLKELAAKIMKAGDKERNPWFDTEERSQVKAAALLPLHGLYLTRLGYPDAAEQILKNREDRPKTPPLGGELALDWTWAHYERAVHAHMRGDPQLVLASLAGLKGALAGLEQTLKGVDPGFGNTADWAGDIGILDAESKRRLKSGETGYLDEQAFLQGKPDVSQLIAKLDRIQIMQSGQPGDVPLWESPIVKALVAKGDEAIEPLLDCLADDPRLTQSVHFWRSFHKSRSLLGVHEAALYALQALLETDFFELAATGDSLSARDDDYRKKLARAIRADWEKYGKTSGPQRAFRILKDDTAGIDAWMSAGNSLLPKTEYDEESGERIAPKGPMPGEVLRSLHDPSVSDLLEKRSMEAGKQADAGDEEAGHGRMALLAILLEWDQARGRAGIGEQAKKWQTNGVWSSEESGVIQQFIEEVSERVPEVVPVFEEMAWTLPAKDYSDSGFVTRMFLKHADALKRKGLWSDPESPWCLHELEFSALRDVIQAWKSQDLLAKEPFRGVVLSILEDDSPCAQAVIDPKEPDTWWVRRANQGEGSPVPKEKDVKFALQPGKPLPVRRKDVAGVVVKGTRYLNEETKEPVLEYYWSLKDRDEWLGKLRAELKDMKVPEPKK